MAKKESRTLNTLGLYLQKRSINKADVCRRTKIHPTRMTWLCYESIDNLGAGELQLIAMAINIDPAQMLRDLFGHLTLTEDDSTEFAKQKETIERFLSEAGLNKKHALTSRDVERLISVLLYCFDSKEENTIAEHLNLKRKSSNFYKVLKVCIEMNWLTLQSHHDNGKILKRYLTTDNGKKIFSHSKTLE